MPRRPIFVSALMAALLAVTTGGLTTTAEAKPGGGPSPPTAAASTTTALWSSANPSDVGQPVTFTAAVSAKKKTPAGSVVFTIDGATQPSVVLIGGQASLTSSTLPVGARTVTAAYQGDSSFAASSSAPLTQTVQSTSAPADAPQPSAVADGPESITVSWTPVAHATGYRVFRGPAHQRSRVAAPHRHVPEPAGPGAAAAARTVPLPAKEEP